MSAISPVSTPPAYTPRQTGTPTSRLVGNDDVQGASKPPAQAGSSTGKLVNLTA